MVLSLSFPHHSAATQQSTTKGPSVADEASAAYDAKDWAKAAELYRELSRSKDAPPRVWLRLGAALRSEEHTSELQSPCNLVCRLLLEKKKEKATTLCRDRKMVFTLYSRLIGGRTSRPARTAPCPRQSAPRSATSACCALRDVAVHHAH